MIHLEGRLRKGEVGRASRRWYALDRRDVRHADKGFRDNGILKQKVLASERAGRVADVR